MKKLFLFLLLTGFYVSLSAQVTDKEKDIRTLSKDTVNGWKSGGVIMLNLSQTSLTNWSAGGENSMAANGLINYFANYKKETFTWENNLGLGLGFVKQGSVSRKSDDKIDLATKFGKKASGNWYYAGLLSFRSQFLPGYNYPNTTDKISNFLAPAYVIAALGMDYRPKPFLSIFLAPITGRLIIVNDQVLADQGAFGVEPAIYDATRTIKLKDGEMTRFEFGGYVKLAFQKDIMTNVNFATKVEAFSNYLKNPQNIVINWEMLLALKVNKYLGASIATQLIYDDAIKYKNRGPRTQFKEILGIGFTYKL